MSRTKIGINGFGRIGRQVFRTINQRYPDKLQVVATNDLASPEQQAHLLKYDSVYGKYNGNVEIGDSSLIINGEKVIVFSERDPSNIPWDNAEVEIIIESTGFFNDAAQASGHLSDGVKKVIITAPATNEDITIVLGVNEDQYDSSKHNVISNASCTTNCVAPMAKVLNDSFGIEHALMSTIHAYTGDQNTHDKVQSDLRRARAAATSIIPTTTGAAKAVTLAIPQLAGKIDGMAYRVPVITGSVTDLTARLAKSVTAEEVNDAFRASEAGDLNGVMHVSDEPLVSADYIGDPHSCTIDALSTAVVAENGSGSGTFVKVVGWYDNEWGYSSRTADVAALIASAL